MSCIQVFPMRRIYLGVWAELNFSRFCIYLYLKVVCSSLCLSCVSITAQNKQFKSEHELLRCCGDISRVWINKYSVCCSMKKTETRFLIQTKMAAVNRCETILKGLISYFGVTLLFIMFSHKTTCSYLSCSVTLFSATRTCDLEKYVLYENLK